MPLVAFDSLPDTARVWIFGASSPLAPEGAREMLAATDDFLSDWRAHGTPLHAARDWREDRFLTIALDTRVAGASGCSLDALFRVFKKMEPAIGASMLDGSLVFFRRSSGSVVSTDRAGLAELAARGEVTSSTSVFDMTVDTLGDWRSRFELPASESWHKALL